MVSKAEYTKLVNTYSVNKQQGCTFIPNKTWQLGTETWKWKWWVNIDIK